MSGGETKFIGGAIGFFLVCVLIYHAVDVGFAAFGHWLWIVPTAIVAGVTALLFKKPSKGIYK